MYRCYNGIMKLWLSPAAGTALLLNLAACGTILHPERKGQTGGRIDAGVAVLDAIGLLFFIIPGVIAFAVDFSNGTIYLPSGKKAARASGFEVVHRDGPLDPAEIERLASQRAGVPIRLDDPRLQTTRAGSPAALAGLFRSAGPTNAGRP